MIKSLGPGVIQQPLPCVLQVFPLLRLHRNSLLRLLDFRFSLIEPAFGAATTMRAP